MSSFANAPSLTTTPTYKLFDANAVTLATFLGSPFAGCLLMAINYHRLGHNARAVITLFVGIFLTVLLIFIGWTIKATIPIAMAMVFAARWSAEKLQGPAIQNHLNQGGLRFTRWTAFWIGIIFLVLLFSLIFAVVYSNDQRTGVMIGTKDEVFYSGTATREEARVLGNGLKSIGFFTDKGVNVFVEKGKDGTIISYVVADGTWDKPEMLAAFEKITRDEAPTVGGLPITLRLVNTNLDVKKSELIK